MKAIRTRPASSTRTSNRQPRGEQRGRPRIHRHPKREDPPPIMASANGRILTLAVLAKAKCLAVEFLHGGRIELRDNPPGPDAGVAIPVFDQAGQHLFDRVRDHLDLDKCARWKLQPKNTPTEIYGAWRLDEVGARTNRLPGHLFIVEGESDCWTLWFHRYAALGIPGANKTNIAKLRSEHIRDAEAIYYVVEQKHGQADQGGKVCEKEWLPHLLKLGFTGNVYELRMPDGLKDPSELHIDNSKKFLDRFRQAIDAARLVQAARGDAWEPLKDPQANGQAQANAQAAAPPPPVIEMFTAAELMRMQLPETKWAVKGLLPEGLDILAGKPKLGKSWLAFNLAVAIAAGGVALGTIEVEAGDVLYLALEDTKRRLQSRLRKLLSMQNSAAPVRLTLATAWPRADKGGLEALGQWLDAHRDARLVIIDTWARFRRVRVTRGNEYEADYADAVEVKELADRHGVAVLPLHHCRKMEAADPFDEVSGTLGLTAGADAILVLRRARSQADATLHVTGRDVEEDELALRWDAAFAHWSILGNAQDYRITQEQQEVINELKKHGAKMKPAEMAVVLGKKHNTVKVLMWRMAEKGLLTPVKGGFYELPVTGVTGVTGVTEDETDPAEEAMETPWN